MKNTKSPEEKILSLVNQLRKSRGLSSVNTPSKPSRHTIAEIAKEAWKKYPKALADPNYTLTELTLSLVQKEIDQKVSDLRRGITVVKGTVPNSHF